MGLLKSIVVRDPAARNRLEVLLLYKGVHAIIHYRIAHFFYKIHLKFIALCISNWCKFCTGIEIHPAAKIGKRLFIDHGVGLVIGETTIIGDDCTLYQGVTLGGTGKETGKRHPTLNNNVLVGAGAKVLGNVTLGNNVKVATNAVVLKDVPDDCTAVGIPARVIYNVKRPCNEFDMDQVDIPDPVKQELECLKRQINALEETLTKKKK